MCVGEYKYPTSLPPPPHISITYFTFLFFLHSKQSFDSLLGEKIIFLWEKLKCSSSFLIIWVRFLSGERSINTMRNYRKQGFWQGRSKGIWSKRPGGLASQNGRKGGTLTWKQEKCFRRDSFHAADITGYRGESRQEGHQGLPW